MTRENEAAAVAVAATLAAAARQRGGSLIGTAAELHAMGSGPLWPRSALEMDRATLPVLSRRGPLAGATVTAVSVMAGRLWHIAATPLPPALVPPLAFAWPAAPVAAIAAAPPPAPVARAVAAVKPTGMSGPSAAEFERVKAAAEAETARRSAANWAKIAVQRRANEHAKRVEFLANTPGTRTTP